MKQVTTVRRTDVTLSVGTLALVLLAAVVVAASGSINEFVGWAWERHHNVLSWYIRPCSCCRCVTLPIGGAFLASCSPWWR
jgi:hypothetical protein